MNIPVIDITRFSAGSPAERQAIAQAVDAAARTAGFMQITGHGIPDTVLDGLKAAMDGFFGQPLAAKMAWRPASVRINRGYSGPLSERLSYSLGVASAADLFEAFNVGAPASNWPELGLDPLDYPENLWPDTPAHFRTGVEAWFVHAGTVARRMTAIFALALGLPEDYFAPFQDHSLDVLRMNHYAMPEGVSRVEVDQMGMGAHTDYGIVTVLWADPVMPGLQVLDRDGQWHEARPVPGALLINLGDMMARWTNDRWISSMHRVLPPVTASGQVIRRRSAAYFHDGNADAIIACLPGCADREHPPLYPPTTVSEHLRAKLGGSRALELNADAVREAARLATDGTA
jgi:isopenicillin N synthase-like dioxygenase